MFRHRERFAKWLGIFLAAMLVLGVFLPFFL
jgi:hypothetical protein